MRWLLVLAFAARGTLSAGTAADFVRSLQGNSFDPSECYRVRDITIIKEDLKIYLTDGHLIFSRPVAGRRIAAAFTADVDAGDGEVILMPPNRAERTSLASYTNSPNLDEHFRAALFIFTGSDYDAILSQLPKNSANRKVTDVADAMDQVWTPSLRNMSDSFQIRVALDLLGGSAGHPGLFAGLFENSKFGSFDVVFDPNGQEQIAAGRVVQRENQNYFDTWTSFPVRSARRNPPPRQEDVLLSDYRIASTLNSDLSLDCVTRVKVKPLQDGATAVAFEMTPDMTLASASVDGRAAEILQRESVRANIGRTGDEVFLVFPPQPLQAGREYEFEFKHSGKVIRDAGDHVYYVTARGNWYPTHNLQFAQYDLEFRYPADLDLVAAGDVVEDRTDGDRRITRRRTASAIRFAAFNLGHYEHVQVERSGYVVDVCANRSLESALKPQQPPQTVSVPMTPRQRQASIVQMPAQSPPIQSPVDQLRRVAGDVVSSLEFMVSKFGPPALPHITISPIPGNFGQGFPGLIYISTMAYLKHPAPVNAIDESQQLFFDDFLQAHEVAHQWWGNRVTTMHYRDAWLMEALAQVSALLYIEKHKSMHAAETMLDSYRALLLEKGPNGQVADAAGPVTFGGRLNSSQAPGAYRTITYGKGIWVMQMLRRRMGDERFLAMLLDLIKRYDHREITTDEFRQAAAASLPPRSDDPKLETFFEQWVNGTGIPGLKLSYSVKGKAPQLRLVGTLTQSEVESDFSTLAPVEIEVARGQSITQWVRTGAEAVTFTVPLKQAPLKVTLDPHYAVLRRM
jgi:hypothetical protein